MGAREDDYRAVGASFAHRHGRLDEGVAEMRRIWRGAPPFDGADEVGPRPFQAGGPRILAGAMSPKAIARAARWADGIYAFSMNGEAQAMAEIFERADAAWRDAGRSERPRRVAGFWFCLASDARTRLRDYVYRYLRSLGEAPARAIAAGLHCHEPQSIRAAIDGMRAIDCDELMLVPASAELAEVDGAARLAQEAGAT